MPDERAIRNAYAEEGVEGYYRQHGAEYRNPNEEGVLAAMALVWPQGLDTRRVLDLGCGSGEATLALRSLGVPESQVLGCDPYTGAAYQTRTGQEAMPWAFADLATGCLGDSDFSLIIASFSLHLCPESLLPAVMFELNRVAGQLLILSPHKRPDMRDAWGWSLVFEGYVRLERVRVRLYQRA